MGFGFSKSSLQQKRSTARNAQGIKTRETTIAYLARGGILSPRPKE